MFRGAHHHCGGEGGGGGGWWRLEGRQCCCPEQVRRLVHDPEGPVPSQHLLAAGPELLQLPHHLRPQPEGEARGEVRPGEAGPGAPAGGRAGAQGGAGRQDHSHH